MSPDLTASMIALQICGGATLPVGPIGIPVGGFRGF